MKILLILPPFERLFGTGKGHFPIGLGYLASYVEKKGFDVSIYNAEKGHESRVEKRKASDYDKYYQNYIKTLENDEHFIWKEIESTLIKVSPDIVGLTVKTPIYGSARKITQIVKKVNPNSIVVWGGPHPTIQSEEVLQDSQVDFVVRGEGEQTFLELCEALKNNSKEFHGIKGLSYKMDGNNYHNPNRELIGDLDSLPFPAKHLDLRPELYTDEDLSVIVRSRGCPFKCGYCGAKSIWSRRMRHRSSESVLKEIAHVIDKYKNNNTMYFWDDSFTASRKRVFDLCEKIIQSEMKIRFSITTRVDLVDYELLKKMKQAGLFSIDFGIETGSPRMLKMVNKGITLEQVLSAVKICEKLEIYWNAFFMVGFPDETKEDIDMTLSLIKKIKPRNTGLSIFTPYPGTELYERAKELGLIPDLIDWTYYSHHSPENHFVKNIDKERFKEISMELAMKIDKLNYINKWKKRVLLIAKHPVSSFNKVISKLTT